jgi:hypothetical protein
MIGNINRVGNFTSSEIVALTKKAKNGKDFGAPALTYIEETNFERKLGRSIDDEKTAKPLTWGHLIEGRVFDLLGLEYTLSSTETDIHPTIPFWSGSKDGQKFDEGGTVIDIKSPFTLKSFCQLVDPLYRGLTGIDAINDVRDNHKDGEKYYWQLVSNAIINGCRFSELIVYMPYKSELDEIKLMAQQVDGAEASKHYWIAMAGDDELPFLLDDGYYKNLNIIRFEVPEADKKLLTECVLRAGAELIPHPKALPAPDDSLPYEMILDDANALKI